MTAILKACILVICILGLTACNNGYIAWSPDGTKLAFLGRDGLRFADPGGNLSGSAGAVKQVKWFADSKRILVVDSEKVPTWNESKQFLTESQQAEAISLSQYIEKKLEQHGVKGLEKDPKVENSPDYITSSALLYLRDTSGENLRKLLGKDLADAPKSFSLDIERVCIRQAGGEADCMELWHGLNDIVDVRISPDSKYVLLVQKTNSDSDHFDLSLISAESQSSPVHIAVSAAKHPDWSSDSRQVFFLEDVASSTRGEKLGALCSLQVRNEDGTMCGALDKPTRLLYLVINQSTDLHCMNDGRILFNAPAVELPATEKELMGRDNVYTFKPGDRFAKKLMATVDAVREQSTTPLQLNPDQTKVILGCSESLHILDIATGLIHELKILPELPPCWRTSDEICFAKPLTAKSANRHDAEIVLHSLSTGKEHVISENWPASSVDEILIHKKNKK